MRIRSLLALLALLTLGAAPAYAGDHTAANETIWPSQNDIAQTAGDGKKLLENQWAKPLAVLAPNNYTLAGLTVPGTSASLSINVALGSAYISGRHITIPGATAVTAAASNTNYLFLKLTLDASSLVTGVSFEVNTSSVSPANSILLYTLTAGATTITATQDLRTFPARIQTITSGIEWTVPAGIRRVYVEVIGASGGGGGGGGSASGATAGTAGSAGGTSTFSGLSVTGGGAGFGGVISTTAGSQGATHGVGSGGTINRTGGGNPGGAGGGGGGNASHNGGDGGTGGYASSWLDVTPDSDITLSIGAAGSAGSGGAGSGGTGAAGRAGTAGMILIHY